MFKQENKINFFKRAINFIWPSIGWRRSFYYILARLSRIKGSAYSIAAGFACGAAISFSPFVGLHFILGAIWAYVIRGNIFAAILGTAVGNPWTFPFIWIWVYQFGCWIYFDDSTREIDHYNFNDLFMNITYSLINGNFQSTLNLAKPILLPMTIGSLPTMIFIWIIFYFTLIILLQKLKIKKDSTHNA